MHRLGLRVGWAADFGDDDLSALALRYARAEGLDEALFVHHERPYRRVSVAASLPDDRCIHHLLRPGPGSASGLQSAYRHDGPCAVRAGVLQWGAVRCGPPSGAGQADAIDHGWQPDGGSDAGQPRGAQDAEPRWTSSLPNALEARHLTGQDDLEQAARQLAALGPLVVVKDGAAGALACQADQLWYAPALPITPVDTTGAGDCFSAGFVKARLMGRSVAECLRWANIVGGLSTLGLGGTSQRVTAEEVVRRFDDGRHGERRTC